jgi:hypothetical protein
VVGAFFIWWMKKAPKPMRESPQSRHGNTASFPIASFEDLAWDAVLSRRALSAERFTECTTGSTRLATPH